MKNSYLLLFLLLFLFNCSAKDGIKDPEETVVVNDNGTTVVIDGKEIWKLIKTTDGGYIGIVHSGDYEILKFDSDFNLTWEKEYGGSKDDFAESIIQTNDGGFLIIGWTKSSNGDVSNNYGDYDIWIVKINSSGELLWEKNYGGSGEEGLRGENLVKQTTDGGFVFIGHTDSSDNDVSNNLGSFDIWLVKISATGDIELEKTFGGSEGDYGREVLLVQDGYVILGKVNSLDGDFNERDNWIFKANLNGGIDWKTNLNSSSSGTMNTTSDGRIISVMSGSFNYQVKKIDAGGSIIDNTTISTLDIRSSKRPTANKVIETNDNKFIIIGDLGNGNLQDAFSIKLDENLNRTYYKSYFGVDFDKSRSIFPVSSDQYIYQFITNSNPIDDITYSSIGASIIVRLKDL